MNRNLIRWFRWLILIPATIGLTLLYAIYVNPVLTQGFGKNIEHALNPFISFALVVLIAYLIAPSYKFKTSLIFGCLSLLLPFVGIIIVLTGIKIGGEEQYVLDGGIGLFATLLGVVSGLLITWKLSSKNNNSPNSKDEAIIKRIENIEGLGGMTVNERLYLAGLYDEFFSVIKTDKARARKILTWIKVDEPSIDNILKNQT